MSGFFFYFDCIRTEASDRDAPRRLGKRPPSLRHGQNKKCTWYHPECAMIAFAACSKKSRVVERVEDIDYCFESLSQKDQQRIRKAIANRPVDKSVVQRKPSSKPRKCHKSVPIVGRHWHLSSSLTQGLGFAAAGLLLKSSFPELSKDASSSPPSRSPLILRLSASR